MLAANIGAGSTVGATGLGYRDGVAAWWWVGSAGFGSIVLAIWIGPAIRRLAAEHDLRTVGDFLELRYSSSVRAVVSLLLWIGSLSILAGQLIAVAWILNVVTGLPKAGGCLIAGIVVTIYFTAGGLLTSAWVNMVQLTVKLAGFAIALPLALAAVGGWSAVRAVQAHNPAYWNPWHGGASGWMYLAMLGPAFVISPGLLQKIYGARDDRAVRLGVGANAIGLLLYAPIPPLMGMIARARFPALASNELALPTILMYGVPPIIGSIGLAAVFSAEISAADAVLFMLTTSLSKDLYSALRQSGGRRSANDDGDARGRCRLGDDRRRAGDRVAVGHRRAEHLLHAARRQPVRADHRRAVLAARVDGRSARRDRLRRRGDAGRAARDRRRRVRLDDAGDDRTGRGRRGVLRRARRPGSRRSRAGGPFAAVVGRAFQARRQGTSYMTSGLFSLAGKTAAVIGAGSGIGEAVAVGAAAQGATVVCLDMNEAAATAVAVEDRGRGDVGGARHPRREGRQRRLRRRRRARTGGSTS